MIVIYKVSRVDDGLSPEEHNYSEDIDTEGKTLSTQSCNYLTVEGK